MQESVLSAQAADRATSDGRILAFPGSDPKRGCVSCRPLRARDAGDARDAGGAIVCSLCNVTLCSQLLHIGAKEQIALSSQLLNVGAKEQIARAGTCGTPKNTY
eukprot:scaffold146771_cov18-Tisochrysis_lutea.AAC.1